MGIRTSEQAQWGDHLRAWLPHLCQAMSGTEAALAVLGRSENDPTGAVAHWPAPARVTPRLTATVTAAIHSDQVAVQAGKGGSQGTAHIAVPVSLSGTTVGAVGFALVGVQPAEIKNATERVTSAVRALEFMLEARSDRDRVASLLSLAGILLHHASATEGAQALAAKIAHSIGCERVAVGRLRGRRIQVLALSTNLRFQEQSEAVRELRAAMEEATTQDAVIEFPTRQGAPPHDVQAHEHLLRHSGRETSCTVPLASQGRPVGALTCEWSRAGAIDDSLRSRLEEVGILCGPILELMARSDASPLERMKESVARSAERHFGSHQRLAPVALAVAGVLIALLTLVPGTYRVSARAHLEGRVQRALVAAVPGYLAEANARAGDVVRAGDLLARLDDRDLRLEIRTWQSQKTQLEKEYREALAGQNRIQVSILLAQIEQAAARLELAEEGLERTSVIAPFDGIVLEGDLDRALGSPVERGAILFQLAPLDGYRVIVEVDGRDIADVAAGQTGRLVLSALPGQTYPLVVERITPISTSEGGRTHFRAEATLEESAAALRPGMEGIAKIDIGERNLLWIWTHTLFDWLRLRAWSFVP